MQIRQALPEGEREAADVAFSKLAAVEYSLTPSNKERFTNALNLFRREMTTSGNAAASYPAPSMENSSIADMGF